MLSAMGEAGIAPLTVWDVHDPDHGLNWDGQKWQARAAWLRDHEIPASQCFRVEFYLIDAPFARIFCYALNGQGRKYYDRGARDAAKEPPRDVPLDELPPEDLR